MESRVLWISSALSLMLIEMVFRFSVGSSNCINSKTVAKIGISNEQGIVEWLPACSTQLTANPHSYVYEDLYRFSQFKYIWAIHLKELPYLIIQDRADLQTKLTQKLLTSEVKDIEKNELQFSIRTEFLKTYIFGSTPSWLKLSGEELISKNLNSNLVKRWHFDLWWQYKRSNYRSKINIIGKTLYTEPIKMSETSNRSEQIRAISQELGYLKSPRLLEEKFVFTWDRKSENIESLDIKQAIPVIISENKIQVKDLMQFQNIDKFYWIKKNRFYKLDLSPLSISLEDFVVNNPHAEILEIHLGALRLAHQQLNLKELSFSELKTNNFSKSLLKWQSQKVDPYKIKHIKAPINIVARMYF